MSVIHDTNCLCLVSLIHIVSVWYPWYTLYTYVMIASRILCIVDLITSNFTLQSIEKNTQWSSRASRGRRHHCLVIWSLSIRAIIYYRVSLVSSIYYVTVIWYQDLWYKGKIGMIVGIITDFKWKIKLVISRKAKKNLNINIWPSAKKNNAEHEFRKLEILLKF